MKKRILLLAAILVLAVAQTAGAYPSMMGPTGVINTPNGDVLKPGSLSLGFYSTDYANTFSANLSIVPDFEIGAAHLDPDGWDGESVLNAKFKIWDETAESFGFAVGIEDITDELDRSPYIVATKQVNDMRLNIGLGGGRFDGLFASMVKPLNPNLDLVAEFDGDNLNAGVNFNMAPGFKVHAGLFDMDDFYVGVSFTR